MFLTTLILSLLPLQSTDFRSQSSDIPLVVENVEKSLVRIECDSAAGSGFVFIDQLTVLTNRHVVETESVGGVVTVRGIVKEPSGLPALGGEISGVVRFMHPTLDIAVIELEKEIPGAIPIKFGKETSVAKRGIGVLINGVSPHHHLPMVSKAIVSSIYIDPWDSQIYYLFDVEINSGFSGGPIVDHEGNLIAITSHGSNVEGVSWTWGVPSLSLVDLFKNGKGVKSLSRYESTAKLIEEFRSVSRGKSEMEMAEVLSDGLSRILKSRATIRVLLSDQAKYVEECLPEFELTSQAEVKKLCSVLLKNEISHYRRANANYYFRGDGSMEDFDKSLEVSLLGNISAVGAVWRLLEESNRESDLFKAAILTAVTDEMVSAISNSNYDEDCRVLSRFSDDEVIQNATGRARYTKVKDAYLSLSDLETVYAIAAAASGLIQIELSAESSASIISVKDRFDSSYYSIRETWDSFDVKCKSLVSRFESSYEERLSRLDDLGFKRNSDMSGTYDAKADEGFYDLFDLSGLSYGDEIAFLGYSSTGGDIDLVLQAPNGENLQIDEEEDHFPLVVFQITEEFHKGIWKLYVINCTVLPQEVTLDVLIRD